WRGSTSRRASGTHPPRCTRRAPGAARSSAGARRSPAPLPAGGRSSTERSNPAPRRPVAAAVAHAGAPDVDAPAAVVVGLAPRDRDVVRRGVHAGAAVADRDGATDPATGEPGPDAAGAVGGGDRVRHVVVPSPHDEPVAAIARRLVAERAAQRRVAAGQREAVAAVLRRAVALDPVAQAAEREAVAAIVRRLA